MHEELLMIYYFFRRIYINYGNITWGSTSKLNLKKQAVSKNMPRESYIEEISHNFTHLKYLFREIKVLNVFQLNILNNLVFMHKTIIKKKKQKKKKKKGKKKYNQHQQYPNTISLYLPISVLQRYIQAHYITI